MSESGINFIKHAYHILRDYRNTLVITLAWIFTGILSENSLISTINQILRFFLYPINLIIFHTDFSTTTVPSIFIILMPVFFTFVFGFLYLISTED